jgi:hypothetical protein
MKLIDIINNSKFQKIFLKHFIFENGEFIKNEEKYKTSYYYNDNSTHDNLLKESYAFFISDEIIYVISDGNIICYDSESTIRYIGDNIINSLYKIKENDFLLGCEEVLDFNNCINSTQILFGEFDSEINIEKGRDFLSKID